MPHHTSHQLSPRVLLRQQMAQVFIESELKTLCFDLGIDFEELGQGNKTDKIISLIRLVQRQGRLVDLRAAVVDTRPHLAWPTLEALESSQDEERYEPETNSRKLTREEQLAQRNRQTMLLKVKAYWIDGVLANSLHSKVIPLDMERNPGAVTQPRPWDMLWQHRDQQLQPLPSGTRIIDRFNYSAGDALLILGEPGSGKTTMLLELAGELLEWAEQNEALRIPVVFNQSSWAVTRPPLTEWLVSELQTLYLIPKKVARTWVEQDEILPLLDGLDEVAQEHRADCIKAINTYRKAQGTPLVVCSRIADYEGMGEKLLLSDALLLRPLTPEQINEYLAAGGSALDGVHEALQKDEMLREMAQSPLLLSIMVLAYRDLPPEQFTTTNLGDRRLQLFTTYVKQMLSRRRKEGEVIDSSQYQLTWLAQRISHYDQTVFLIERLQPSWLLLDRQRRFYRLTVLILVVITGIQIAWFVGLLFTLVFAPLIINVGNFWLDFALFVGPTISGLVYWMNGEKDGKLRAIVPVEKVRRSFKHVPVWVVVASAFFGILAAVLNADMGLPLGELLFEPLARLLDLMTNHLLGTFFEELFPDGSDLFYYFYQVVDSLIGMVAGLFVGGIVSGIVFITVSGVSNSHVELKTTPNEGIKNSAQNALYVALVNGLLLGLLFGLFLSPLEKYFGLYIGLLVGAISGLIQGGGGAVIQHYTLRFFLYRYGYLPWKLVPFLDLATERLILQKVGGGYRFVHRLLQEYLASLYAEKG